MKHQRNLFKVMLGGAIVLAIIGGSLMYIRQSRNTGDEKVSITLLSHNVDKVNTNPLAYISGLEKLSDHEDPMLKQSARKLVQVNKSIASNVKVEPVKKYFCKANIRKIVEVVCEVVGFEKNAKQVVKSFVEKNGDLVLSEHFRSNLANMQQLDKNLRASGKQLPSPIFYHRGFLESIKSFVIKTKDGINESVKGYFTNPWINELKEYLPVFYAKMGLSADELIETVITYYLFQHYVFDQIYEEGAMEDLVYIAEYHEKTNAGKDEKLAEVYADKEANVISLQDASYHLAKYLYKDYGYVISDQDKINVVALKEDASCLNLYKKDFIEKNGYTITKHYLDREKAERYRDVGVEDKDFDQLFTNRVNINRLENDKHILVHISFHADDEGSNTKTFLQSAFDLIDEVKQNTKKPVYVMLCLDGGFTIKSTKNKLSLDTVTSIIEKADCKVIQHEGYDIHTTKKECSHMQVHMHKAGKEEKELSDMIIVSNNITIVDISLSPYTELSSHRAIEVKVVV